jgi:hypothetical protein
MEDITEHKVRTSKEPHMKTAEKKDLNRNPGIPALIMFLAVLFLMLPNQALSWTYNIPDTITNQTLTAGTQASQNYKANGNNWLYYCYVPPTWSATSPRKWPVILYHMCGGAATHWANGWGYLTDAGTCAGYSGYLKNQPQKCHAFSDSFVVVSLWIHDDWNPGSASSNANYTNFYPPLVAHLAATANIDTNRIHLTGFCYGGNVAYKMATMFPNVPASLSIWGMWQDNANANDPDTTKAGLLKNIPMNIIHGGQDDNPWQHAKQVLDCQTKAGNTDAHWYLDQNGPHEVWIWSTQHYNFTDSLWYPWMLSKKRTGSTTSVRPNSTSLVVSGRQSARAMVVRKNGLSGLMVETSDTRNGNGLILTNFQGKQIPLGKVIGRMK